MDDHDRLARRFEAERPRLRGIAHRMLGSLGEADDAVQEAWLRLRRTDAGTIDNLGAWLTTVVARVCLDMLRTRTSRREEPLPPHPPGGGAGGDTGGGPEDEAVLAESVGLALLVVLDALTPAERVAFVLHDLFAVPFDDIAPIVDRTPTAAKKLASRARHRVRGTPAVPGADLARRRRLVDAFLAASRRGDVGGLLAVLDPDVVRRADPATLPPGAAAVLRGARAVAEETRTNAARARFAVLALVDGTVGVVVAPRGHLVLVLALTIDDDRGTITAIEAVAGPTRVGALTLAVLDPPAPAGRRAGSALRLTVGAGRGERQWRMSVPPPPAGPHEPPLVALLRHRAEGQWLRGDRLLAVAAVRHVNQGRYRVEGLDDDGIRGSGRPRHVQVNFMDGSWARLETDEPGAAALLPGG